MDWSVHSIAARALKNSGAPLLEQEGETLLDDSRSRGSPWSLPKMNFTESQNGLG